MLDPAIWKSTKDTARRWGCSDQTVRNYVSSGKLPAEHVRYRGNRSYIHVLARRPGSLHGKPMTNGNSLRQNRQKRLRKIPGFENMPPDLRKETRKVQEYWAAKMEAYIHELLDNE